MSALVLRHALLTVGVVVVVGALLSLAFRGPGDASAIWTSGVVAVLVQLAAFSLGRVVGAGNLTARIGVGALLRFLAIVTYALVVVFLVKQAPFAMASLVLYLSKKKASCVAP